jgi:hypothetical protein
MKALCIDRITNVFARVAAEVDTRKRNDHAVGSRRCRSRESEQQRKGKRSIQ